MNYLFWDTERIRNTKIYMSAIILTDAKFNIIKQERVIDTSIDVSKRTKPKEKVEKFKKKSTLFKDFISLANWLVPYLKESVAVCFGESDFKSLNDQLKIHGMKPILGEYIDLCKFTKDNDLKKLSSLSKAVKFLKINHEAHDPLSDSFVTMELFKYLVNTYGLILPNAKIPNICKILDIEVNGSYPKKKDK